MDIKLEKLRIMLNELHDTTTKIKTYETELTKLKNIRNQLIYSINNHPNVKTTVDPVDKQCP